MDVTILLSKVLGYFVAFASLVMKVPQILSIIRARSGEGISLQSYAIEIFLYCITYMYYFQNNYPTSTYIENLFLMVQDIAIVVCVLHFSNSLRDKKFLAVAAAFVVFFVALLCGLCPLAVLGVMQTLTIPFFILCKIPQIVENFKARSTGSLSLATFIGLSCGNLVRIFTSITEISGNYMILSSYLGGLTVNLIIVGQIIVVE